MSELWRNPGFLFRTRPFLDTTPAFTPRHGLYTDALSAYAQREGFSKQFVNFTRRREEAAGGEEEKTTESKSIKPDDGVAGSGAFIETPPIVTESETESKWPKGKKPPATEAPAPAPAAKEEGLGLGGEAEKPEEPKVEDKKDEPEPEPEPEKPKEEKKDEEKTTEEMKNIARVTRQAVQYMLGKLPIHVTTDTDAEIFTESYLKRLKGVPEKTGYFKPNSDIPYVVIDEKTKNVELFSSGGKLMEGKSKLGLKFRVASNPGKKYKVIGHKYTVEGYPDISVVRLPRGYF